MLCSTRTALVWLTVKGRGLAHVDNVIYHSYENQPRSQ